MFHWLSAWLIFNSKPWRLPCSEMWCCTVW